MTITDQKYVLLRTYRGNGEGVDTPIWIAPLPDGRAGFTTGATSGKVKRIRNNPTVTLQPCSVRGKVLAGTHSITATAMVVTGADSRPIERAIAGKYWFMANLLRIGSKVRALLGKGDEVDTAIVFTFE